ncbi:MAG: glycosyltransferase [Bacteroidetes bacterium]|nr:glycosyltransferase [Bacteroidota bacterium]
MKLSVITVSYNSASTIRDTIESVLNQSYKDVEFIIIDGQSKDDTVAIVQSYGNRISKFISEKDKGLYDAMNKGIRLATGDVIGILNSDDFYAGEHVLSKIASLFQPEIEGVYADLVYVSPNDTTRIVRTWKSGLYKEGDFLKGWMPPHPTFFVRKTVYEKYGVFTDKLKSAADYELMLRFIHGHKIKIDYLPEVTIHMRAGGKSNASVKNRIRANKEDRLAWKMNNLKPGVFTFIRKPLSKLTQFLKR